jgi:hypothetical protein
MILPVIPLPSLLSTSQRSVGISQEVLTKTIPIVHRFNLRGREL